MARRRVKDRPTLLTDDRWAAIIEHRASGGSLADCAALTGIGESTLHDWLRDGRLAAPDSPLAEFAESLENARVEWKRANLARVAAAAHGGEIATKRVTRLDSAGNVVEIIETITTHTGAWQAAAWILERQFPMEFGRVIRNQPPDVAEREPDAHPSPTQADVLSLLDRLAERQAQHAGGTE